MSSFEAKLYALHFDTFKKLVGNADIMDQKSTAKDKLSRLPVQQFTELSTDVYDEVLRREQQNFPFLPVDVQFHPKRNQARQKLATLQMNRFQELCRDVMMDIERRVPEIGDPTALQSLAVRDLKKDETYLSNSSINSIGSNHQLPPNVPNEIARKDGEIAKLRRELTEVKQQNTQLESSISSKNAELNKIKSDLSDKANVLNIN